MQSQDDTLVYPYPVTEDPRIFVSPTNTDSLYDEDTLDALDQLLQTTLLYNSTWPTPVPEETQLQDRSPDCPNELIILDNIGRVDFLE